jgi:hypothetical protein
LLKKEEKEIIKKLKAGVVMNTSLWITEKKEQMLKHKARFTTLKLDLQGFYEHQDNYRTMRIAVGRNTLIETVEKLISSNGNKNSNIYTAMIDLDGVMTPPINKENFENRMHEIEQWDVITFNSPNYYDIWALRYSRYDINVWAQRESPHNIENIRTDIKRQLNESIGKYYPVYSAFNGLAVYKYDYTIGCKYNGSSLESGNKEDCEHVAFHRCITAKHGGRIMIHVNHLSQQTRIRTSR